MAAQAKERVKMLHNVLGNFLSEPNDGFDPDITGINILNADMCRAVLMKLYSEDPELGGVGWRNAIDEGEKLWKEMLLKK